MEPMQRMPSTKARSSTGASTSAWGQGARLQSLHCLCDGLTGLYATRGRKFVDATDDPAFEHVCSVAGPGAVCRYGSHRHAMLVRPRQTSDPRLIPTDAAVMMNGRANASFGREIRRVSRGIRTANNDGTVCIWRQLDDAINHQHRDVLVFEFRHFVFLLVRRRRRGGRLMASCYSGRFAFGPKRDE